MLSCMVSVSSSSLLNLLKTIKSVAKSKKDHTWQIHSSSQRLIGLKKELTWSFLICLCKAAGSVETMNSLYYYWAQMLGRQFKHEACHEYDPAPEHGHWPVHRDSSHLQVQMPGKIKMTCSFPGWKASQYSQTLTVWQPNPWPHSSW